MILFTSTLTFSIQTRTNVPVLTKRPKGSLKNELVHHRRFATRGDAKREITEYIEIFYNRIRKQARLGYLSPAAFMQQYYEKQMAA